MSKQPEPAQDAVADGCGGPANVHIHLAERGSVAHILRIPRRIFANGDMAARPRLSFV
jgi:hypothetical protein